MGFIDWLAENWDAIVFALTGMVTAVSVIVKITPTLKDDNVWLPFVKWLSKYVALNRTVDDEEVRASMK